MGRARLLTSVGIAYPLSQGHEPIGSIRVASDIVTVRECVGVAFSFAEKFEQTVFLRWDRHAVSLSRWCHCHPPRRRFLRRSDSDCEKVTMAFAASQMANDTTVTGGG